jgi:hypothetical protein
MRLFVGKGRCFWRDLDLLLLMMRNSMEAAGREAAGERLPKSEIAAKKPIRKPGAFEWQWAV